MSSMSGGEGFRFESPLPNQNTKNDENFEKKPSQPLEAGQTGGSGQSLAQAQQSVQAQYKVADNTSGSTSTQTQSTPTPMSSTPTVITSDLHTSGGDVIEKGWVDRIKYIITKTRSDPHAQKNAIAQIKNDYLLKRYKKQPRTDEKLI